MLFLIGVTRFFIVLVLAACESHGSPAGGSASVESEAKQGSAGGFSASLSADLAKEAGSGKAEPTKTEPAKTEPAKTEPAKTEPAKTEPAKTEPAKTEPAKAAPADAAVAPPAKAEPAKAAPADAAVAAPAKAEPAKGSAAPALAPATKTNVVNRAPVKPPAPIAAIKLDLEPNWERDVGEAGTFSLVVKVPNGNDTRVFSVRYGYEDQSAPFDCDQYRKFLEDKKVMTVTLNRQRGAACYIEGKDANGVMSYRYLVNYDGKRLSCVGSLYKDPASAALGDLRDKVLMQAKKICETLAL